MNPYTIELTMPDGDIEFLEYTGYPDQAQAGAYAEQLRIQRGARTARVVETLTKKKTIWPHPAGLIG